ncbi:hypothetical protein [Paenirhodobacter enshiensis]|uniref:DUF2157 domain-containing protein n=1 Tax=Paenirhodobacter enshiensis TaxID=1105367 RepID=A0A086Y3K1_9RHOB|nr:hypothetical protein [Paenirhodobacter enshiensis]KFI28851.1 hypothetical protein CG50_11595 [Paenirhodobacter enshiensis]
MADLTREDLRAAVAAGYLTEAQAANVLALAQTRAGTRIPEDEPFELFRGFAEIFVAVGLSILFLGAFGFLQLIGRPALLSGLCAVLAWWLARYYTLKRRMMLPSIVLVLVYGAGVLGMFGVLIWRQYGLSHGTTEPAALVLVATGLALLAWFRVFRLPFSMFLVGLTGLALVLVVTRTLIPGVGFGDYTDAFDLRHGSGLAFGTLAFGLIAFVVAMSFDMRDPHRLGRTAASGFWLHLLAAPALVNTVALTFWNMGPGLGYGLLAAALALISMLALVIDRRSFLTAGIGYLIFLVAYVAGGPGDPRSWAWVLLLTGLGLTLLGTYWTALRARLMRALPDFPGKRRLPPYAE